MSEAQQKPATAEADEQAKLEEKKRMEQARIAERNKDDGSKKPIFEAMVGNFS